MAEIQYTLRSGLQVTVFYDLVERDSAVDVMFDHASPVAMPNVYAEITDDEVAEIETEIFAREFGMEDLGVT